jgi:ubiquinone/menaquinone biosynthesis C-methylase UbiE
MISALIKFILRLFLILLSYHTMVRIVRHFYKFPMPEFMANLIDNPLRRKIQPPSEMPARHGIEPGMTVLEVGPGNGRYTIEAARRVGSTGKVIAVDIEPKMIERVMKRAEAEKVTNLEARTADVYHLPFYDGTFDAIYMITVISEIPEPVRAMREFYRVLSPSGTLAFSEMLTDPDYPLAQTLVRQASQANFRLKKKLGGFFSYTLVFKKKVAPAQPYSEKHMNIVKLVKRELNQAIETIHLPSDEEIHDPDPIQVHHVHVSIVRHPWSRWQCVLSKSASRNPKTRQPEIDSLKS